MMGQCPSGSKEPDCKSGGICLRKFESSLTHHFYYRLTKQNRWNSLTSFKNDVPFSHDTRKVHSTRKRCCCGFHNGKNFKSNKNHHATKMKLLYRKERLKARLERGA